MQRVFLSGGEPLLRRATFSRVRGDYDKAMTGVRAFQQAGLPLSAVMLRSTVRMTSWTPETEGHMIVIEPNGNAQAWPVYD